MHHFDITMALDCSETKVLMDGVPLTGIHAFRVECDGNTKSRIILEISGTASLTGEAQVWVKDETQALFDKADAAENRAASAENRADEAEARADAAEASPHIDTAGGTLAYIVPVEPTTLDQAVVARIAAVAVEEKIRGDK